MSGIVKNDEVSKLEAKLRKINEEFSERLKNIVESGIKDETYVTMLVRNLKEKTPQVVKSYEKLENFLNNYKANQKRVADNIKMMGDDFTERSKDQQKLYDRLNNDKNTLDYAVEYLAKSKNTLMGFSDKVIKYTDQILNIYENHIVKDGKEHSDLADESLYFSLCQQIIANYEGKLDTQIQMIELTELKDPNKIGELEEYERPLEEFKRNYQKAVLELDQEGFGQDSFVMSANEDIEREMENAEEFLRKLDAFKAKIRSNSQKMEDQKELLKSSVVEYNDLLKAQGRVEWLKETVNDEQDLLEYRLKQVYSVGTKLMCAYEQEKKNHLRQDQEQEFNANANTLVKSLYHGKNTAVLLARTQRDSMNSLIDAYMKNHQVKGSKTKETEKGLSEYKSKVRLEPKKPDTRKQQIDKEPQLK